LKRGKLAYIMSRFPHLPETFILREMIELERLGWQIALYPLILQRPAVVHDEARLWLQRARAFPFISIQVLIANIHALLRRPGLYLSLWFQTLWENRTSLKFLLRAMALFPKSVLIARAMQRENVAHIHAHYATHPALVAYLIHRLTGIPYSITVHAHDIFKEKPMLVTKLKAAEFIIAISTFNRDYLIQQVGSWVGDKIHVIHCGVAPEEYTPATLPQQPPDRFEIIHVGSLQPYKGQRYLIQACALLRQQGIPVHCRIVGGGELRSELQKLVVSLGLETAVELIGPKTQEEVKRLLSSAHCYVQPSVVTPSGKMEGIPVALMEAMACGLPVVATALSGIPELIRSGETGYLVPAKDAKALADALTFIYKDPAIAAKTGQAGRAFVAKEFDLHQNTQQLSYLFGHFIQADLAAPG
jgi:colanic acid/amylovoran biosynthesis glycosyltransferase